MNTKDKYHLLCNTETSIPIFSRDWWLDTVCGKDKWKVLLVEEKERITAAMPLYCPRQGIISMPSYTQTMGPWFAPESKDTKYTKTLGHRQVLCKQLLNTLKSYPYFMQNFHYGITDWLPFYWEGYRQTTRYTYMLKDIRNTKAILGNMSFNIRRNICHKLACQIQRSSRSGYDSHCRSGRIYYNSKNPYPRKQNSHNRR